MTLRKKESPSCDLRVVGWREQGNGEWDMGELEVFRGRKKVPKKGHIRVAIVKIICQ